MPVASEDWLPQPAKITSSITTVKGATIQSTTTAWMSPYSRTSPTDRAGANGNNNNNGVVILEGCRPPAATTARRFLRWFSRLGQPPMGKSGKMEDADRAPPKNPPSQASSSESDARKKSDVDPKKKKPATCDIRVPEIEK
ncbi:hypothetical protein KM043_000187 [Ampulex compressa]|nr:hypothetical protein KM043_000187 [Ampulex compressa]